MKHYASLQYIKYLSVSFIVFWRAYTEEAYLECHFTFTWRSRALTKFQTWPTIYMQLRLQGDQSNFGCHCFQWDWIWSIKSGETVPRYFFRKELRLKDRKYRIARLRGDTNKYINIGRGSDIIRTMELVSICNFKEYISLYFNNLKKISSYQMQIFLLYDKIKFL